MLLRAMQKAQRVLREWVGEQVLTVSAIVVQQEKDSDRGQKKS